MNLHELGEDARIYEMAFQNGSVQFFYDDYEREKVFRVKIKTDLAYINYRLDEIAYEFCHVRIVKLADQLDIDANSKLYILPEKFIPQMKLARNKFHLALGLNSQEWKYFVQIFGDGIIIACPVKSSESIDIEEFGSILSIGTN
jgi:hypothetical protein